MQPTGIFAPKSSRVVRRLLISPFEPQTQREIARATGTDEGYTSKTVTRLEREGLVVRTANNGLMPRDPNLILDLWCDAYDFYKHIIIRGSMAISDKTELAHHVAGVLSRMSIPYAATGFVAAQMLTGELYFDVSTFYLQSGPSAELLHEMGFRDDFRNANVWLVIPNDDGVFHGGKTIGGISCVHPIQAYLDLWTCYIDGAKKAADTLRSQLLSWKQPRSGAKKRD